MNQHPIRTYYPRARVNLSLVQRGAGLLTGADGELMALGAIRPRSVHVDCNDPEKADTWSAQFDLGHFPLDPSEVRAAVAAVHIGQVANAEDELITTNSENLIAVGHADKVTRKYSGDRASVEFEGRDYTALFLDTLWGDAALKTGRRLDEMIADLIASKPGLSRMLIETRGMDRAPIISPGTTAKTKVFRYQDTGKVWDGLQDLAAQAGVILTVDRDVVVIQPPRNVGPNSLESRPIFVDGLNLKNLDITRSMAQDEIDNVKVRAVDPRTYKTLEGFWPNPPRETVKITRSKGQTSKNRTQEFSVHRISHPAPTEAILTEVAKRIWEARAQQQLEVKLETAEMLVPSIVPGDLNGEIAWSFDATKMRNGRTIRLRVDRETRHVLDRPITAGQREIELRAVGYTAQVANVLAQSWHTLDRLLFVDSCKHSFDADSGYSLSLNCVNSLEI